MKRFAEKKKLLLKVYPTFRTFGFYLWGGGDLTVKRVLRKKGRKKEKKKEGRARSKGDQ